MKKQDMEPRLQGTVTEISKTGEREKDRDGVEWERCLFTLELKGYSKRTPGLNPPEGVKGRKVKIARYCAYDWHYRIGVTKTLTPDETRQVLSGETDLTGGSG